MPASRERKSGRGREGSCRLWSPALVGTGYMAQSKHALPPKSPTLSGKGDPALFGKQRAQVEGKVEISDEKGICLCFPPQEAPLASAPPAP